MSQCQPEEVDNLHRWAEGRPQRGLPRGVPTPAPSSSNTEVVCHPYYYRVQKESSSGVERWRNPALHPDCAATVLQFSATKENFVPAGSLANLSDQFNNYVRRVSTFPGFFLERNELTVEQSTSRDINLMINQIVNAYVGYGTGDITKMVQSIEEMAESILHKSSSSSDRAIFSQDTVTKVGNVVYITIFYAHLSMKADQHGKKTYIDQKYSINRSLIRVNESYLITYAERLEDLIGDGDLGGWIGQLSSTTGGRKSCFSKQLPDIIQNLEDARFVKEHKALAKEM